jgi:hypothetical protein
MSNEIYQYSNRGFKMNQYSNRSFLQASPSLNAISWQVEHRFNPHFLIPHHFYGKFTIAWGSCVIGIHSYGEHGETGQAKFEEKCLRVVNAIEHFFSCVKAESFITKYVMINDEDTPFSGSVYYKIGETPSKVPICVFEFASCKQKIRLHSHEVGGIDSLGAILSNIKSIIEHELIPMSRNWRSLDVTNHD